MSVKTFVMVLKKSVLKTVMVMSLAISIVGSTRPTVFTTVHVIQVVFPVVTSVILPSVSAVTMNQIRTS